MILHVGTDILSVTESVLLATAWCAFASRGAYRRFPAFGAFLTCRLAIDASLSVVLYSARSSLLERHFAYSVYYYVYWIGYLAGAVAAFLVIQEVFKHLVDPLDGLGRFGLMVFRWITITSLVIALAVAVYPAVQKSSLLIAATGGLMRCMSILELFLLAFIVLSMQTLEISLRSRDFGIALGLAMIAAADLFGSALAFAHPTMASVANYASQAALLLGTAVWAVYFIRPEAKLRRLGLRASTLLRRWSDVTTALDEGPAQVNLTPSHDSFLRDVERAVDRVLEKNR